MKNKFRIILLAAILLGCKNNKAAESEFVTEDNSVCAGVSTHNIARPIGWQDYKKQGFILRSKIDMYDEALNFTLCETFDNSITLVDILQKTEQMMSNKETDNICDSAHFVKIRNDNEIINAFGAEVYEQSEDAAVPFRNSKKENMEIFTIKDFMMGFAGEGELTGCDEYYPIIIKNSNTGKYRTISTRRKDEYREVNNGSYYYLIKNEGIREYIESVSINGNEITAIIHIEYQDGDGTYELKLSDKNDHYTVTSIGKVTMIQYVEE